MIVTYFGWFCLAMLCLAGVAVSVALAAHCINKAFERWEWAIDSKVRVIVGRDIESTAHWFSESHDTYHALKVLGRRLQQGYGCDGNSWRDEWRLGRKPVSEGE